MGRFARCFLAAVLAAVLSACASPGGPPAPAKFTHGLDDGPLPWTERPFDTGEDKFTFALFSDLTGGERAGVFEVAVEQLRLLRPELVLSVGDLIEGGHTNRERLAAEWASFDERAAGLRAPLFHAGGNHDLTNPVMWEVWEQRFGPRYYHFRYKNTLFLVLDTEDNTEAAQWTLHAIRNEAAEAVRAEGWGVFSSTAYGQSDMRRFGRVGAGQAAYFREAIAQHPDVLHTFVILHKPVWESPREEHFATVEAALADRPYTVFYGHEHAYLHEVRHGRDYIRLGTTGGVQDAAKDLAVDHVTLVTVDAGGVDIANLRLSGIFGKDGRIPLNGEDLCFEQRVCGDQ